MRLIAWNCGEGFSRKYQFLLDLNFDVAVVAECGPFDPELTEERELSSVLTLPVNLPRHRKHIGVLARAPWKVERLPLAPGQPWLVPVKISGPVDFTLLAVWALGSEWVEDRLSYAAQTARVVADVLPSIGGPVVLAGDLNAPLASKPAEARRHADSVGQLAARGLVSAFSTARGDVDPLTEPTYYHRRRFEEPFHIDHVFIPTSWTRHLDVSVGTYADWIATRLSDHVPVIVDVPIPDLTPAGGS